MTTAYILIYKGVNTGIVVDGKSVTLSYLREYFPDAQPTDSIDFQELKFRKKRASKPKTEKPKINSIFRRLAS